MPRFASLDDLIARKAQEYADQIKAAAAMADKEEEIRIESEKQLAFIQKEVGIKLEGKHEVTVASGRVDSVYSRVIIEYKNPRSAGDRIGPRADSPGSRKVVEQIKKRFYDMRIEQGQALNSLFGVGLDGNYFIFIRFRDDKWQVQDPVEVNRVSAERFLWALFNLGSKGKAFTPEYLAGDFGSEGGNTIAIAGIHALYDAIVSTDNPKAQTFFSQWKILFGEVCGYDVDNPSDKIKKLAEFYKVSIKHLKPAELLFAVHTYYALFMKLLAAEIVAFFHKLPTPLQKMMAATTSNKLKREMDDLEAGSIFRHLNITNFLEGDLFAWYTSVWTEPIEKLVREMVTRLDDYNPGTLSEDPTGSRDLLKKLYQELFPKSVRHDLGEYYTPDWLAEHVLSELGYAGDPDKRLLDPACGSGTFLVMAINRIRKWYDANRERCSYDEGELCRKILANVIGFDLNPLAVMAARTNYLIAIRDLIGHVDEVEIPVYLCDSILTPTEYGDLFTSRHGVAKELKTAAARFLIPTEITGNRAIVAKYAEVLEFCVKNQFSTEEFLQRCQDDGLPVDAEHLHVDLYSELVRLDKANRNGVWARIIKNAFAPIFTEQVDFVAGNPPWIRWGYLPKHYREETVPLWQHYGLFSLKGFEARLGSGEKDFSQLFTYCCIDNYLKSDGKLGFIITNTVFKAKGQAEGFRRFRLGEAGDFFKIERVHDMSLTKPFEGASNLTAVFTAVKGRQTKYPVKYVVWIPKAQPNISPELSLDEVLKTVDLVSQSAQPLSAATNSQWRTSRSRSTAMVSKLLGKSFYKASVGARIEPYGVYLLRILRSLPKDRVLIENIPEAGKRTIEKRQAELETELIYPVARGKDIERWFYKGESVVLMVQDPETRRGYKETWLKRQCPLTYAYLRSFKEVLESRAAYQKYHAEGGHAFYSMFNISTDTFAPFKVAWRRMGIDLRATVLSEIPHACLGTRLVVASDTVTIVPLQTEEEASYLAGLLNSTPCRAAVYSYSPPGRGLGTPAILQSLKIDRFDPRNSIHKEIARAARTLTKLHTRSHLAFSAIEEAEVELDNIASRYWGLNSKELVELNAMADERESAHGPRGSGREDVDEDITSRMFDIATLSED